VESFGKYKLIERVAIGGMAEIYRAKTDGVSGFERIVAIKRLHHHLSQDAELAQMLVDEAKIAVVLQHPNIAQVFDLGQANGHYFMVMEYIDGPDWHRVLKRMREQQRYAPIPITLHVLAETCAALHFAHSILSSDGKPLQLVHRDVSPQNIMVTSSGEVKLVDFGIAKARHRMMETQAGIIKGKFYYMAPEQAHGHHLDGRTDVFAVGMVLYETLTGRAAYEDAEDVNLLKRARTAEFHPPSAFRPDLDPALEAIVLKALQRDPNRRYQSARELQHALQSYLAQRREQLSREQVADFVQQLNAIPAASGRLPIHVAPQQIMNRQDFSPADDSLLYRGPLPESTDPTHPAHFNEGVIREPNDFEDDGPTYIYNRDEDNPFAIPDSFSEDTVFPGSSTSDDATVYPGKVLPQLLQHNDAPAWNNSPDRNLPTGFSAAPPDPLAPQPQYSARPERPQRHERPQLRGAAGPGAPSNISATLRAHLNQLPPKARIGIGVAAALLIGTIILLAAGAGSKKDKPAPEAHIAAVAPVEQTAKQIISISSKPLGAQVFLDGVPMGTTPTALVNLHVGERHTIRIKHKKYPAWEDDVLIRADHAPMDVDLTKLEPDEHEGILKIVTHPPNLRIEINDEFVGNSPTEILAIDRAGSHTVVAVHSSGAMRRQIVSWLEDEPNIKVVELSFKDDLASTLPKPPEDLPKTPTNTKKPPYKKPTYQRPAPKDDGDKALNIWGKDSKKPADKPKPKEDDGERLNIW
jgi:serine/threonine protein kinase